jgi:hypothetical protein
MNAFPDPNSSSNNHNNLPAKPTEYQRYRQSPRWRKMSLAVRMRAKGRCEICRRAPGVECAHVTYERIFFEPLEDLLWLCKKCHRELDEAQQM